jgi:hypothetical protein
MDIDPDGYLIAQDSGAGQPLADDGTRIFSQVPPGNHVVALSGVASNFTVAGADPQSVDVTVGVTAQVEFPVTCVAIRGDIQVTVATSGADLPLGGYTLTVDSGHPYAVSVNETVVLSGLTVGQHRVELGGIAANCGVLAADPITVQVTFGVATHVDFSVDCASLANAVHATTLVLATWDGSGQVFHPDIVGDRLAITTYPMGDASKELPVWYQRTDSGWSVPAGASNPLWSGARHVHRPGRRLRAGQRRVVVLLSAGHDDAEHHLPGSVTRRRSLHHASGHRQRTGPRPGEPGGGPGRRS